MPNFQHMAGEEWLLEERPVVQLTAGEWTVYNIEVAEFAVESLLVRVELQEAEALSVCEMLFDNISAGQYTVEHLDGGNMTWQVEKLITPGQHQLKVKCVTGRVELLYVAVAFWCLAPKRN